MIDGTALASSRCKNFTESCLFSDFVEGEGNGNTSFIPELSVLVVHSNNWRAFKNTCVQAAPQINRVRILGGGIQTSVIFTSFQVIPMYNGGFICTWAFLTKGSTTEKLPSTQVPHSQKHSITGLIGSRFWPCFCHTSSWKPCIS